MGIYVKDNVLKVFGVILVIFGFFILLVGVAMCFDEKSTSVQDGLIVAGFSLLFLVPGVVMLRNAGSIHREEDHIEKIVELVKVYRRIPLKTLAEKTGLNSAKIEEYLGKALTLNMISGKIDRTTNEFFTDDAVSVKIDRKTCPTCGTPFPGTFIEGDTIKCPSCGNLY